MLCPDLGLSFQWAVTVTKMSEHGRGKSRLSQPCLLWDEPSRVWVLRSMFTREWHRSPSEKNGSLCPPLLLQ